MTEQPSQKKIKEEYEKITNLINFQERISSEYIARIRKKERLIKYLDDHITLYKTNNPNQRSINDLVNQDQDVITLTKLIESINNETKNKEKELAELINKLKNYSFVDERIKEKEFEVTLEKASDFFDFLVAEYLLENERLRIEDQIHGREVELDRMKKWEKAQQTRIDELNTKLGAGMCYKMGTEDGRRSELYIVPDGFDKFDNFKVPYVTYDDKGKSKTDNVNWNDHSRKIKEFVEGKKRKIVLENGGSKFSHLPAYDICIRPQIDFCEEVDYETTEDGQKKKRILGYRTYCTNVVEVDIEDLLENESIEKEYKIPIQIDDHPAKCKITINKDTLNGQTFPHWDVGKTADGRRIYDTVQVQIKSRNYQNAKIINRLGKDMSWDLSKLTPRDDGTTVMIFTDEHQITYVANVPTDITERETRPVIFTHTSDSNEWTLLYMTVKFCGVDTWKQKCVDMFAIGVPTLNAFITSEENNIRRGFLEFENSEVIGYSCPTKYITTFNKPIPLELGFLINNNQKVWRMVCFHNVDLTNQSSNSQYYISWGKQTVVVYLETLNDVCSFKSYAYYLGGKSRVISIPVDCRPGDVYDKWIGRDESGRIELIRIEFDFYDQAKNSAITRDRFFSPVVGIKYEGKYSQSQKQEYTMDIDVDLVDNNRLKVEQGLIEIWKDTKLGDHKLLRYYDTKNNNTCYYGVFHFMKSSEQI